MGIVRDNFLLLIHRRCRALAQAVVAGIGVQRQPQLGALRHGKAALLLFHTNQGFGAIVLVATSAAWGRRVRSPKAGSLAMLPAGGRRAHLHVAAGRKVRRDLRSAHGRISLQIQPAFGCLAAAQRSKPADEDTVNLASSVRRAGHRFPTAFVQKVRTGRGLSYVCTHQRSRCRFSSGVCKWRTPRFT